MSRLLALWLSLLVLAAGLMLRIGDPVPVAALRHITFDAYQRWQPRPATPLPVKIIDIDDESLARFGQWPWPRDRLAEMVDRLREAGAATVAFDMVFPEPDRSSPSRVVGELERQGIAMATARELPDHDTAFAKALERMPVVTGFALDNKGRSLPPPVKFGVATAGADPRPFLTDFDGTITSLPAIEAAAAGIGTMNFSPDFDGVVRRVPLLVRSGKQIYPSLALEALRTAQGAKTYIVKSAGASGEVAFGEHTGIVSIKVGGFVVPTDGEGRLWVRYNAHDPSRYLAAWKLLDKDGPHPDLEGAIVLVGTSAVGLLDLRYSPLGGNIPGVEIQAQVLEQILQADYVTRPDWADGAELLFLGLLGITVPVLTLSLGALTSAVLAGGVLAGAVGLSLYAFSVWGLLIDPLYPVIVVVGVYAVASVVRHIQAERDKRWLRQAFKSYVSPNLVEEIIRNPDQMKLGGERRELSFVFTDLAGFTPLVEQAEPGELIPLLNEYLDGLIHIGFTHGGTLDGIVGDATAFFFNAPVDQPDHARRAVACALEMDAFAEAFREEKRVQGLGLGVTRIGVHTGTVIVGNMGGEVLFNYCAHGDAINTAARLETVNKHLGTRVCVSGVTAGASGDFTGRPVGGLVLKGKNEPVQAFEPLPPARMGDDAVEAYLAAFALLRTEAPGCLEAFRELAARFPDDPLARFHLARLERGETGARITMAEK